MGIGRASESAEDGIATFNKGVSERPVVSVGASDDPDKDEN